MTAYRLKLQQDMRTFSPHSPGAPQLARTDNYCGAGTSVVFTVAHMMMYDHRPQIALLLSDPDRPKSAKPLYVLVEEFSDEVQPLAMHAGVHFCTSLSHHAEAAQLADAKEQFDALMREIVKLMQPHVELCGDIVSPQLGITKPLAAFNIFA